MRKKRRVKKMNATAKPIGHMKIGFNSNKEFKNFVDYAFGDVKKDSKTQEIKEMIKSHKRSKKME